MALSTGTRLGPYEILSAIGAGGMGEVYRAKDTRLDRIVAIKILPSHLSGNEQLKQRFEREARAISSITHPNICALYDIGQQNGTTFLVMEFLEGESLAKRLNKGSLPTEHVLKYGIQIAEALDRAHRQGIVHRDLKPGNIIITKSGAKLLDFGLAKYEMKSESAAESVLETRDGPLTEEGVVLGTVQYMAPEQIEGRESDARTDIFALGEVIYEMSTGQRTFKGNSKAQLMASIMTSEPQPISTVQPLAPPALEHVIKKCLAKDPEDRWQNARDVASELRWISEQTSATRISALPVAHRKLPSSFPWILSAILTVALLAATIFGYRNFQLAHRAITPELLDLSFPLPENTTISAPGTLAISPDGRHAAVCVITKEGNTSLWLRSLNSSNPRRLPGSDDAQYPFWSPDSRFVGFFAQGKLKKIDIDGGPAQTICDAPQGRGATWNANGQIVFSPVLSGGLSIVSATEAGPVKTATIADPAHNENSHRWPFFLPDGKHFLFTIRSAESQTRGVYVGSLDGKEKKRVLGDQIKAEFAPPGYLIFVREGNLMAVPFDLTRLEVTGEALPIAQGLDVDIGLSTSSFSVANNGSLIYMNYGSYDVLPTWVDRSGKKLSTLGQPSGYFSPQLSPNQKMVAFGLPDRSAGSFDVWIVEWERGIFSRLTSNPASDNGPVWSPDSTAVAFNSNRGGIYDIYSKPIGGAGSETLLYHSGNYKQVDSWSPDGRYIIFEEINPKTNCDLMILSMSGDHKASPYLQSEFNEAHAEFSPDGKWIAYVTDETGRSEIYVQRFPIVPGTKRQVSTAGGDQPFWRSDQKELFYVAADGKVMAMPVKVGDAFEPGVPTALFETHFSYNTLTSSETHQYVVSGDGQRFLLDNLAKEPGTVPINVMLNWMNLIKK